MASLRNLKKDINYLTTSIIEECYAFKYLFPGVDSENILEIISDSVLMHNQLIHKINNPEFEIGNKSIQQYYKNIFKELITTTDSLLDKLNKLTPEK